jgi:hypothetical protein
LIVSVYGPKINVEVPKDALSALGADPEAPAPIVTAPVL